MARRIPWMLWLGAFAGFLLFRRSLRSSRRRLGVLPGGGERGGHGARIPPTPEVVHGRVPVERGLERPVATRVPAVVPERAERPAPPRHAEPAPDPARFEPVVPDAPEELDQRADPVPMKFPHAPVPPTVRRRK